MSDERRDHRDNPRSGRGGGPRRDRRSADRRAGGRGAGTRGGASQDRRGSGAGRPEWSSDTSGSRRDGHTGGRGGRNKSAGGGPRRGGNGKGNARRGNAGRSHAQRAGRDRNRAQLNPQRPGFREERISNRTNDPEIPADVDVNDLDPMVLQDLKVLSKQNADKVARHLAAAAVLMDESPRRALEHARAAKDRAGRVAVTRETNGIAAYRAGEWHEALSELRAARRMSGGPGLLAVMADCERGLGRPERALEMARGEDADKLDADSKVELAIVAAGARTDLGDLEAAVTALEAAGPSASATGLAAARLSYAYADALLAVGRRGEALDWFNTAARQDESETTDAAARAAGLEGGSED